MALELASPSTRLDAARQAAARAHRLQGERVRERVVDVLPALVGLFPDDGLRPGSTYQVDGSTSLTSALLAKPTSDGLWCAVVGMPGFSAEAAAGLGCDLDRLVFVPHPGRDWLRVVAALVDALTIVVVRTPARVSDGEAARLSARLRQRETVLIACGAWPRSETRLSIRDSVWTGVGAGHGRLRARQVTVGVSGRGAPRSAGRPGTHLWLPDAAGSVRLVDESPLTRAFLDESAPVEAAG